jgi:flagellar export protein FliJ
LVTYRERLERLQEQELAEAQRLYVVRMSALTQSRQERERFLDTPVPGRGPLDPADLAAGRYYRERIEREIGAKQAAVAHSEADVAEERDLLLARRRDRKAIEALLDRRNEEDRVARNRVDIKRIDELAISRWQAPAEDGGRS